MPDELQAIENNPNISSTSLFLPAQVDFVALFIWLESRYIILTHLFILQNDNLSSDFTEVFLPDILRTWISDGHFLIRI